MGLFSRFGANSKKVTDTEYNKTNGIKSGIMSHLSGSSAEKKRKMAEIDTALRPSFDEGGTKTDDGIDAAEAKRTFDALRQNDPNLSLNKHDIDAAEKEVNKWI